MTSTRSDRRMVENEAYFRSLNQQIQQGIDKVNTFAQQDGQEPIDFDADTPLFFLCECADENCVERIRISLHSYNKIHQDPKSFCIAHDHQVDRIEAILKKELSYTIVRKYEHPPETASNLNVTAVDNSAA